MPFKVIWADGTEETIRNPAKFPDNKFNNHKVAELQEPYVLVTITLPEEFLGKDVLAKLHAADVSRRRKLLENQKEGRKKLKAVGNITIETKAFQAFLAK